MIQDMDTTDHRFLGLIKSGLADPTDEEAELSRMTFLDKRMNDKRMIWVLY